MSSGIFLRLHYIDVLKQEIMNTKSYVSAHIQEKTVVSDHVTKCEQLRAGCEITQHKLPTMYWIPKLHKKSFKARFNANSSSCTTTKLSILLTSCLTKIKEHVKFYCDKAYENSGINLFWSIKNSTDVLKKLRRFLASTVSTYDFFYSVHNSSL